MCSKHKAEKEKGVKYKMQLSEVMANVVQSQLILLLVWSLTSVAPGSKSLIKQGFLFMCLCQGQRIAGDDWLARNKGPVTHWSKSHTSEVKHVW